ncbi:MAG: hypothetical protein LBQ52_04975 [Helicobacteraceae bacterium]|jgi:hypothetical protein|nr:hypothetical protein [Helicobacteraceae bacterium]
MKNKYLRRSHISEGKFREITRLFSSDLDATQIAEVAKLNRNTINAILSKIRARIVSLAEKESFAIGEIEIDESDYTLQNLHCLHICMKQKSFFP